MKTILFPTDFSENADNAMHYALEFALKLNAQFVLLNVCLLPYGVAARIEDAVQSVEAFYDENLQKLVRKIKQDERYKDLTIKGKTVTGGIVNSILEAAEKYKADLIVMGTKGTSGIAKMFFGSNTAEVLREATTPVLVVPGAAAYKKFDKLIFAIDYREDDLDVLLELKALSDLFDINIETVHIAPKDSLQEQILHRGMVQLIDDKVPALFTDHHLLFHKSFFKEMESFLNSHPNALLAMAHYKKPFLDALVGKSITEDMAYHAKMPLLIFNKKAKN